MAHDIRDVGVVFFCRHHATKARLDLMLRGRHPIKEFFVGMPQKHNGREEWEMLETLVSFKDPLYAGGFDA